MQLRQKFCEKEKIREGCVISIQTSVNVMLLCGRSEWLFNQQQALPAGWGSGGMQSTSTEQAGFPLYNWLVQNLSVPSSLAP